MALQLYNQESDQQVWVSFKNPSQVVIRDVPRRQQALFVGQHVLVYLVGILVGAAKDGYDCRDARTVMTALFEIFETARTPEFKWCVRQTNWTEVSLPNSWNSPKLFSAVEICLLHMFLS